MEGLGVESHDESLQSLQPREGLSLLYLRLVSLGYSGKQNGDGGGVYAGNIIPITCISDANYRSLCFDKS